jgi:hypothetical protein
MACVVPVASVLATGCIIPEAPDYSAARQTPIFIQPGTISPNPLSLVELDNERNSDTPVVQFHYAIRSEDAGEELTAALYLDYKHLDGLWLADQQFAPLTFDKEHQISIPQTFPDPRFPTGHECHAITVMVMHSGGYAHRLPIGTPPDLASVTWFVDLNAKTGPLLVPCPDSTTESSDAISNPVELPTSGSSSP